MALRAATVVALLVSIALVPAAAGVSPPTPDQQLVTGLERATQASRTALRHLAQPTAARRTKASEQLQLAAAAVDGARKVAPRAVGALETRSMRAALGQGATLGRQAARDVANGRYPAARTKIRRAVTLTTVALREFGQPLTKDFPAFAVNRNFRNIPAYREYSGVTATAGEEVVEIIIGIANRETAKAGEPDEIGGSAEGLPITTLSGYQIQDPIGRYTTNHCFLEAGLITCPLRPTLRPQHSFTLAFGPRLERGTRILVKFRTATGRRSFSVFSIR